MGAAGLTGGNLCRGVQWMVSSGWSVVDDVGYNQTWVGARTVEWERLLKDVFDHGSCCVMSFLRAE